MPKDFSELQPDRGHSLTSNRIWALPQSQHTPLVTRRMRKLAFRKLSGRGLWEQSGSSLGRAPPETLCEPAEALDGAPKRRSRKWRAALQFHSPDMDFQLRVPRLLVRKKAPFHDFENHALIFRFTGGRAIVSLNNDTHGDTKKCIFSGYQNISLLYGFTMAKRPFPKQGQRPKTPKMLSISGAPKSHTNIQIHIQNMDFSTRR